MKPPGSAEPAKQAVRHKREKVYTRHDFVRIRLLS